MSELWNLWHGCHKKSEGCQHCYVFHGGSAAEVSDDVFPGRNIPAEGFGGDVSIEEGITAPPNPSPTGAGWP